MVLVFLSFSIRLELSYIVIFSTLPSTLLYCNMTSYVVVVVSIVIVI
jgi:hypothetical protein